MERRRQHDFLVDPFLVGVIPRIVVNQPRTRNKQQHKQRAVRGIRGDRVIASSSSPGIVVNRFATAVRSPAAPARPRAGTTRRPAAPRGRLALRGAASASAAGPAVEAAPRAIARTTSAGSTRARSASAGSRFAARHAWRRQRCLPRPSCARCVEALLGEGERGAAAVRRPRAPARRPGPTPSGPAESRGSAAAAAPWGARGSASRPPCTRGARGAAAACTASPCTSGTNTGCRAMSPQ